MGRDAWNKRKGMVEDDAKRVYVESLIKVRYCVRSSLMLADTDPDPTRVDRKSVV